MVSTAPRCPRPRFASRWAEWSWPGLAKQQATTAAGNGDQSGVKIAAPSTSTGTTHTESEYWDAPGEFQAKSSHQESQEHCAAVTHENLGRFEIPAEKSSSRAENCRGKDGYQRLAIEVCQQGKERRSHRCYSGAQAIHVIQDAKRRSDTDDPNQRERDVQQIPGKSADQGAEDLGPNAAEQQNSGRRRHADEEFHLVMEPAAVVQNSNCRDERGTGEHAFNLRACWASKEEQNAKKHTGIHRQSAQQGNRLQMNLARTRKIHHAHS
jgi:hypothetical protein